MAISAIPENHEALMNIELGHTLNDFSTSFARSLLKECELMAHYAISNGIKIPVWAGNEIAKIGEKINQPLKELRELQAETEKPTAAAIKQSKILESDIEGIIRLNIGILNRIHGVLADTVAPATPRSIEATESTDRLNGRIKIPLIRRLLKVSLAFLFCDIIMKYVITAFLTLEVEVSLLQQVDLVLSAGIGASFYELFTANKYVVNRTFDPKYSTVYWSRFILGIIAGFILANFLADSIVPNSDSSLLKKLSPSLLALLGGYASDAVNKILQRLVDMLVTLVRGSGKELAEVAKHETKSKVEEAYTKKELAIAQSLSKIYSEVESKLKPENKESLEEIISSLVGKPGNQ
ncbi:MAG: hypothetical protein GY754_10985 [bacterium]|nr:hypothetical protein [bacterium]